VGTQELDHETRRSHLKWIRIVIRRIIRVVGRRWGVVLGRIGCKLTSNSKRNVEEMVELTTK